MSGFQPYAELLEFNQPNPIRKPGFTRVRDAFPGLSWSLPVYDGEVDPLDQEWYSDPERIVEFAGRWDYGENNARRLGETSKSKRKVRVQTEPDSRGDWDGRYTTETQYTEVPIIQKYIDMGHESMLEMGDATFFIECSRVVSHELVRHRIVSYQQESQRFVKYDGTEEDIFFMPPELQGVSGIYAVEPEYDEEGHMTEHDDPGIPAEDAMSNLYEAGIELYSLLRAQGVAPQIARYVLPNAMRTRLIMKTNAREWRHICKLRLDKSAQPEMRVLMQQVYDQLVDIFPNVMYGTLDGDRGVR